MDLVPPSVDNSAMDIVAHGLWAGLGLRWLARRRPVARGAAVAAVVLAVVPDLAHMMPVLAWTLFDNGSFAALVDYAMAMPGNEPSLPPWVALWSHHFHCVMHSALIAGAVTLLLWPWRRVAGLALGGWWLHIVIDVLTHSAEFYPVPVLYPLTQRGFDGLAWNTPWFMVANYAALVLCALALARRRR